MPLVTEAEAPVDVPEGRAQVLMSATLFKEWVRQTGATIVSWGEPEPWAGQIYAPTVKKENDNG